MSLRYEFEPLHFDRKFNCVAAAAVDFKGRIFVMTDKTPAMTVLDANGQFLYDWPAEAIVGAHGVFIDKDDFVYCADSGNHTVSKFTTEGERIFQLGNPGIPSDSGCINGNFKTIKRGAGPFNVPSKVTVSDEGEIFVTDGYGNSRIHRFSPEGELILSWGEPGDAPGQLHIPYGIGVSADGRVYVADRENSRVQIFSVDGRLEDIWENIYRPDGLCVRGDRVYVAELGYRTYIDNVLFEIKPGLPWSQCRVFSLEGKELTRFGEAEEWVPGNLFAAHSINLDAQGNIYIGEAGWPENERPLPPNLHPALQKFRLAEDN